MEVGNLKQPAHLRVYKLIRDMILYGELAPGEAVTIQGLTNVLGAGMTPVREAIRRLTSEGALEFMGNRRVCVPVLTEAKLDEFAFARLAIEPQLARWGAEKIGVSKVYELDMIDRALNSAIAYGNVREYLIHNYRFHMTIYQAAGKPELLNMVERLWLKTGPSLRMMFGRFGTLNLIDMHQQAMAALRDNRPDKVEEAMREDILQGIDTIRSGLFEAAERKDNLIKIS
ncbi:HTH-type transcriptional regulator McbR [Methyloligella halotolerans]|uniref:HTH-type transcriptional regulator McbR n=1 Tax=Methyloligella halotolerans TaxID=1177755 RepID=A0A1E2RX91_9HYPH|nr:GntR family transcriptional regulator [Methyloligella halotolerans]ODA66750.1 HTH-type transcriptional regulator McbR [Methyloligella halotolerans]